MKLFHVIATSVLGTAMALGTGFALANKQNVRQAKAEATDATIVFGNNGTKVTGTSIKGNDSAGVEWTISTTGTTSFTQQTSYSQIGSKNAPATGITLEANLDKSYKITNFSTKMIGGNSGASSTVSLLVDDEEVGSDTITDSTTGSVTQTEEAYGSNLKIVVSSIVKSVQLHNVCYSFEESAGPSLKTMTIKDSGSVASDSYTVNYGNSGALFYAYEDSNEVSPTWESSDETIFTVEKADKHAWVKGVKPGTAKLNATLDGYKKASVNITINPGDLSNIAVTGSMSTTSYTTAQSWKPDGLVVTANYSYGYSADVTSEATWTYAPAKPAEGVTSVVATASFGGKSASSTAQAVTVTVANDGSEEHPYTASEALEADTKNNVYVSGIISKIDDVSTQHGNATYYISDDGTTTKQFKVYRGKYLDNASFASADQIAVGDAVTIYGNITVYQSVNQMAQGNYLTKLEHHALETITTIQGIYSGVVSQPVDVHGYYAGFITGTGPIIMNGEYGVVIFDKEHDVSGYTVNETKLHVTGVVDIFKGLYEIKTPTVETSTASIATPVTYTVTGGETAIHQSRSTFVGGTLKSVTSSGTKWTSDTNVVITVNSVDINCFAKANAFTAEQGAAIEAKLSKSITFKGFTGWYNGFQVQLTEVVATGTYTLEQFVSDFLTKTTAVCGEAWVPGSNHKSELQTQVWNYLNSETRYQAMSDEDKETLRTHVIVKDSTDLDRVLERYEFLVNRYELGNFLERSLGSGSNSFNLVAQNNNTFAIVAVTSVIAIISLTGFFLVIRKRKHQ